MKSWETWLIWAVLCCLLMLELWLLAQTIGAEGMQTGWATWISSDLHGDLMADGTPFDEGNATIAAANNWPLGTRLYLESIDGRKGLTVTVRDRGAFEHELDLSYRAFSFFEDPAKGWVELKIDRGR